MKEFVNRLISVIVLLLGITIFPVWLIGILGVIFAFIFDNFFEILIVGIVYDIALHVPGSPWYLWVIHTGVAIIIYLIMIIIQKNTQKPEPLL